MPFGSSKPKRIEETTAREMWLSLFFGTLIGGVILVTSFFQQRSRMVPLVRTLFRRLLVDSLVAQAFSLATSINRVSTKNPNRLKLW